MTTLWAVIGSWFAFIVLGIVVYYLYTRYMPTSVRDYLKGLKTTVLGVIVGVAPDVMSLLVTLQTMGSDWEPTPQMTQVLHGIGMVIVVLRFITDREHKED
jgi:hypothetical protein